MKHKAFVDALDDDKITAAITAAEAKTTGEIRVFVSRRKCVDALGMAEKHFKALGMMKTKERNAVLIFIAPKSQSFAIFGDTAVHAKCGQEFWSVLRDEMTVHLKEGRYTDAVVHGIAKAGELLAAHFPKGAGAEASEGQLPNKVERD
jgi:uncharacterized membrane protein